MKVVVLWSGGVESTSVLLWALQQPGMDVHAHFVELHNQERRHLCERRAINALRPMLQQHGEFTFGRSAVAVMDGNATAIDAELLYPIGRVVMRHLEAERVLRGWCAEDEWMRCQGAAPMRWRGPRKRFEHIANAALGEGADVIAPWLPMYAQTKAWHWATLGAMAKHTWSCRRPVGEAPCGICHSCLERAAAERGQSGLVFPAMASSPHAR